MMLSPTTPAFNLRDMMARDSSLSGKDAEIVDDFVAESRSILDTLDKDLHYLEHAPDQSDLVMRMFRGVHTIKGISSFLNAEPITVQAHHLEEVLYALLQDPAARVSDVHALRSEIEALDTLIRGLAGEAEPATSTVPDHPLQAHRKEVADEQRYVRLGLLLNRCIEVAQKLAGDLEKHVEGAIEGGTVEIHYSTVARLSAPLIHLMRNAVDHGIELPEVRTRLGKPPVGHIRLAARLIESHLVLSVEDDGAGIDPVRIKSTAAEFGLIPPHDTAAWNERDAFRILFHPGFTTSPRVSRVSGRGVGLDVVRAEIGQLGGTVDVDSSPGLGTQFHITIPITERPELRPR